MNFMCLPLKVEGDQYPTSPCVNGWLWEAYYRPYLPICRI